MEKYLRYQFYEHPSISAVLARHWANNYVKPDDAQGSKIKALKTALKTLQIKVDFLRTAQDKKDKDSTPAKNLKGQARHRVWVSLLLHDSMPSVPECEHGLLSPDEMKQPNTNEELNICSTLPNLPAIQLKSQFMVSGLVWQEIMAPLAGTFTQCIVISDGWPSWLHVLAVHNLQCDRCYLKTPLEPSLQPLFQ
jgi:hypothetical protein